MTLATLLGVVTFLCLPAPLQAAQWWSYVRAADGSAQSSCPWTPVSPETFFNASMNDFCCQVRVLLFCTDVTWQ